MTPRFSKLPKKQRREACLAIALASILGLLIAAVVAWEIGQAYEATIAGGRTRASNLALVLEEQTRRSVEEIDEALLRIATRLRETPQTPSYDHRMTAYLRTQQARLPFVRAFFVVGADGSLIQDSHQVPPNLSLADRDYFKVHRDNTQAGLYVGVPLKSRSARTGSPWFLSVSRRITLPDGRFYGVAVASMEPRHFAQFYKRIDTGRGGAGALIHRSGKMIARYPDYEGGIGLSLAGQKLFTHQLTAAETGTFFEFSKVDGTERLYGYRTVEPLPLIVSVGLSKSDLLRTWRSQAIASGASALGIILILIGGTVMILRRRARDLAMAEYLRDIERIESLGRITGSVAHDFNNLLTVIGGNLEMMERQLADDHRSKRQLSAALRAVDLGDRMVRRLLAFAREEPVQLRKADLCAEITGMLELLRQAARPCEVRFISRSGKPFAEIDSSELERALMNLIVNARDACKGNGIIEIALWAVPHDELDRRKWPDLPRGEYIACEVRDDGQGIPPELLHRVFEPFFTTKPRGAGTGLGLSQVYGFARRSGGGAYIESALGHGTAVTIMLPQAPPGAEDAIEAAVRPIGTAGKPSASTQPEDCAVENLPGNPDGAGRQVKSDPGRVESEYWPE